MSNRISPQISLSIPYFSPILGVNFRLARKEDLENLRATCYPEIDWEQFQDHYRYLLSWQENRRCYILIAEHQERSENNHFHQPNQALNPVESIAASSSRIIGSGQLIPKANKAEIAELVVHPDHRNRGIGSAIIQILTQIARDKKIEILEIGVSAENIAALRLYRRLGFDQDRIVRLPDLQEAIFLKKSFTM